MRIDKADLLALAGAILITIAAALAHQWGALLGDIGSALLAYAMILAHSGGRGQG